jgi:hypothetical protein
VSLNYMSTKLGQVQDDKIYLSPAQMTRYIWARSDDKIYLGSAWGDTRRTLRGAAGLLSVVLDGFAAAQVRDAGILARVATRAALA